MKEADGTKRIVHYEDKGHGFEAKVKHVGKPHYEKPKKHGKSGGSGSEGGSYGGGEGKE